MPYTPRLQGAMVATRSIDETSRRGSVSLMFRGRIASLARATRDVKTTSSSPDPDPLASAGAVELGLAGLAVEDSCDNAGAIRRHGHDTLALNVFVTGIGSAASP